MPASVFLLDEGTALAFVGIVAIVAVCLLSLALVGIVFIALTRREQRAPVVAPPAPVPLPRAVQVRRRPVASIKGVEIDVPTQHADAIIHALMASGWSVRETGEVVATDEDEEALTTISVDVPADAPLDAPRPHSGEEVH